MQEGPPNPEAKLYSRQRVLGLLTGGAVVAGLYQLGKGVRIGEPKYDVGTLNGIPDPSALFEITSGQQVVQARDSKSDLVFSTSEPEIFENNPEMAVAHRAGNNLRTINDAYENGIRCFDIDANYVRGKVYGEHGLIPTVRIWKLEVNLPFVIDVDRRERKLKLGRPTHPLETLISYIKSLSTPEDPTSVAIELKRGFKNKSPKKVFEILKEHDMPAVIKVQGAKMLESALIARNLSGLEELVVIKDAQKDDNQLIAA